VRKAQKVIKQIEHGKYKEYKPWEGYFARLETVEVVTLLLEK